MSNCSDSAIQCFERSLIRNKISENRISVYSFYTAARDCIHISLMFLISVATEVVIIYEFGWI